MLGCVGLVSSVGASMSGGEGYEMASGWLEASLFKDLVGTRDIVCLNTDNGLHIGNT